jgi:quinoprotein dehydrogenase-associated probable ABC transporter substrate-binding protein
MSTMSVRAAGQAAVAAALLAGAALAQPVPPTAEPAPAGEAAVLRVCADPNNLPQSNKQGEGYENQIAAMMAHDLGRRLEYTYFPQRLGFVRNTLKARDEATQSFKCDLIVGVPKGYELTATTRPYMRSIYALVVGRNKQLAQVAGPDDLLKLPDGQRRQLRIGLFAQTPAGDWMLQHGLIERAVVYPAQSGDPAVTVASVVEHDLAAGTIDAAILWGPIAGYLVSMDGGLRALPFTPQPGIKLDYEISMGVRQGEKEWLQTVDGWIGAHRDEIARILGDHHVPLLPVGSAGS